MGLMGDWQAVRVGGRKRPLYYYSSSDWPDTVVLGHYESPCGGCDTVGSAAAVYELTTRLLAERPGVNVLQEGLLLSEDVKWTAEMPDVVCLFLVTDLDQCLDNIKARRAAAGNGKELKPDNTANRVRTIERARGKLVSAGVDCRRCSARQAPDLVLRLLRLHARGRG